MISNARHRNQRRSRHGIAVLVLVMAFLAALFVVTYATSSQGSNTARAYARAVLTRTCLEAAESAFAEAMQAIQYALRTGGTNSKTYTDWSTQLYPPYNRAFPTGIVDVRRTRDAVKKLYDVDVATLDVRVVNWVEETHPYIKGHGVLELSVVIRGRRASLRGVRTVKTRVQFIARVGASSSFRQVVLHTRPLAVVIEDGET